MIDVNAYTSCELSIQEIYDIIHAASDMAEDAGFFDSLIFAHALADLAMIKLCDVDVEIDNPLVTFNTLLEDGCLNSLVQEHSETWNIVAQFAKAYEEDYKAYLLSVGGALFKAGVASGDNLDNLTNLFQQFIDNDSVAETLKIADSWGMRDTKADAPQTNAPQTSDNLFTV